MLDRLFSLMLNRSPRSRGQGLVEYALIIALVAIVVIATLILLGGQIQNVFENVNRSL